MWYLGVDNLVQKFSSRERGVSVTGVEVTGNSRCTLCWPLEGLSRVFMAGHRDRLLLLL